MEKVKIERDESFINGGRVENPLGINHYPFFDEHDNQTDILCIPAEFFNLLTENVDGKIVAVLAFAIKGGGIVGSFTSGQLPQLITQANRAADYLDEKNA